MCGIVALIGQEPVVLDTMWGLRALQHRGQESTGIFADNRECELLEEIVRETEGAWELSTRLGDEYFSRPHTAAIGHVRYVTSGANAKRDAQPIFVSKPPIVMAHNGQVADLLTLKAELKQRGWGRRTDCDVELILNALADQLQSASHPLQTPQFLEEHLWPALRGLTSTASPLSINGSYSLVALFQDRGLLAFRDPNGIRPFVMGQRRGEKGLTYAFASESAAFDHINNMRLEDGRNGWIDNVTDLQPGEAVFVDYDMNVYRQIIESHGLHLCGIEFAYFCHPTSVVQGLRVEDARERIGAQLACEYRHLISEIDVLVAVPDSARSLDEGFDKEWEVGTTEGLVKNRYNPGRTFIQRTGTWSKGVARKFTVNPEHIRGKKVGLTDDSLIRGSTAQKIVRLLRAHGVAEIHLFLGFPPPKDTCYYAMDLLKEDLIYYQCGGDPAAICTRLGVDSVNYISEKGFEEATGLPPGSLCLGCVNGRYPTDERRLEYDTSRKRDREQQATP